MGRSAVSLVCSHTVHMPNTAIYNECIIKVLTCKLCISPFDVYRLFFPSCSNGASPTGSVSEAPRKSSKKSKKTTENMTKVYNSVLESVFGAVSS